MATGQTRQPAGADKAGPLSPDEVTDTADTAARAPGPDLSGKRVRAIPGAGGTTVIVNAADFNRNGVEHKQVKWDFRKDNFTVKVGKKPGEISQEAADFLTENYPTSFEYLDQG